MRSVLQRAGMGVRWGFVGLVSGLLSCVMAQSRIVYLAREQKTMDHVVWPGMVFALVVLLPMSRWAGDRWLRTAAAFIASSAVYPVAWQIAAGSLVRQPTPVMIASFAFGGFLGAFVLAGVFLAGRPHWRRAALTTVILGTAVGGLMGTNLTAGMTFVSAGDVLALYMVLWQVAVAASLGRGAKGWPHRKTEAADETAGV